MAVPFCWSDVAPPIRVRRFRALGRISAEAARALVFQIDPHALDKVRLLLYIAQFS
jgi:hypothetical protein